MRITKLIAAFLGVLMVIGSFGLAVGGGIALAVPDDDGWVSAGPVRMQTETVALLAEDVEVDFGDHVGRNGTFIGWEAIPARLDAAARNDKAVFVGVATAADARAYLRGVSVDTIDSWAFHHDPDYVRTPGALSVAPPQLQDIWVASSIDGNLEWDVSDGEWAVVILNSDGTAGVDVAVTGSAEIPFLRTLGVILIAVGLVGMTLGVFLTYYGVRRVRQPQPQTAPPAQPLVTG